MKGWVHLLSITILLLVNGFGFGLLKNFPPWFTIGVGISSNQMLKIYICFYSCKKQKHPVYIWYYVKDKDILISYLFIYSHTCCGWYTQYMHIIIGNHKPFSEIRWPGAWHDYEQCGDNTLHLHNFSRMSMWVTYNIEDILKVRFSVNIPFFHLWVPAK